MTSQTIRRNFLNYFKQQGHAIISSSPVVPHDDPTLLFTNAGMNQFKDVFLGTTARDYTRATTSQKCIRVGGKHNDLENVGHTRRHLTFFEMLGNFSFGDYFKKEAIRFAWEVATQVFEMDPERIWPTVFREDDDAFELWTQYVPASRITRFDEKDNFWAMGDTGPCGPCSELLYDRGPAYGTATKPSEDPSGERFMEFWNLVFMQYNRQPDGKMIPLPKPSIDTGAGLERIVSLKMGVDSVFETDVLRGIISRIEELSKRPYDLTDQQYSPAFRVIADHLRCLAFAIADGVQPSNVDRGYVLRKVLRRAVRYGRTLGFDEPFLGNVLPQLVTSMGPDYPELVKAQARITEILQVEEEAFIRTLRRGGNMLNQIIASGKSHGGIISGDEAFKLKDTYGFPLEEIELLAKDAALTVDKARYQILEDEAKERSRTVHKSTQQIAGENLFEKFAAQHGSTAFVGYDQKESPAKVLGLVVNGQFVDTLEAGEEAFVVLDRTPFYAEMGGQIGDTGVLENGSTAFAVEDTKAPFKGIIAHFGKIQKGALRIGDTITARLDDVRRQRIANNHTATHLLHWALHKVLGEHVKQAGSVVEPGRLRFDFSHHKAMTPQELRQVEDLVNAQIRTNLPVEGYEISYEEAQKKSDIKQFFGEKYGSTVRVIDIDFSKELCGGTHTTRLGNIGLFRIIKESSIAAGMRRIEATTGVEAEQLAREPEDVLTLLADALKTQPTKLQERIEKLLEENKKQALELKELKKGELGNLVQSLVSSQEVINGTPLITAEVELSGDDMRSLADSLMDQVKSGVVILASGNEGRCQMIVRVTDDVVAKGIQALQIVKAIAPLVDGSGGGKNNSAQAGGKSPQKIPEALQAAKALLGK